MVSGCSCAACASARRNINKIKTALAENPEHIAAGLTGAPSSDLDVAAIKKARLNKKEQALAQLNGAWKVKAR